MYKDKELINYLKILANELNRTPRMKDINSKENFPECTVYKDHFGSWNNALISAGLKVNCYYRKWKKEEVIKWLKYKYEQLGRTPGIRDFDEDLQTPSKNTVRKVFGTWGFVPRGDKAK
ncbi:hypothetical protein J4234_00460 [Candidatus Woesearchaeota archaeon]|nr:hypothetical protein [Candidatus Woesearchaeota archaeon]